ncbi:50S ribosomal protein L11 methyltransferase [Candidatus Latescibacterota bacterium]
MSDLDWHRGMLADRRRVRAFADAVQRAVRPGDVVVDIGTGSGLLALVAARAGAAQVYAIDEGPIIEAAQETAVDNGLADRIVFLRGRSPEVEIEERADLVVGEILGSFGLDEDIRRVYADARARFLKQDGRLLPDQVDLVVAPSDEGEALANWPGDLARGLGLDFTSLARRTQHVPTWLWARADRLLAPGSVAMSLQMGDQRTDPAHGVVAEVARRCGQLCGWVGWFVARWEGRVVYSTEPPIHGSSWQNAYYPIGDPVPVQIGDRVAGAFRFDDPFWSWELEMQGGEPRRFGEFDAVPVEDLRPSERGTG